MVCRPLPDIVGHDAAVEGLSQDRGRDRRRGLGGLEAHRAVARTTAHVPAASRAVAGRDGKRRQFRLRPQDRPMLVGQRQANAMALRDGAGEVIELQPDAERRPDRARLGCS